MVCLGLFWSKWRFFKKICKIFWCKLRFLNRSEPSKNEKKNDWLYPKETTFFFLIYFNLFYLYYDANHDFSLLILNCVSLGLWFFNRTEPFKKIISVSFRKNWIWVICNEFLQAVTKKSNSNLLKCILKKITTYLAVLCP